MPASKEEEESERPTIYLGCPTSPQGLHAPIAPSAPSMICSLVRGQRRMDQLTLPLANQEALDVDWKPA